MVKIITSFSVGLTKIYNFYYFVFISGITTAPPQLRLEGLQEVLNFATITGQSWREA